jgi:hypothetical protein
VNVFPDGPDADLAARDVALIRRALTIISAEAARPAPPLRAPRRPAPWLGRAAAGLAVASVAAALIAWFAVYPFAGDEHAAPHPGTGPAAASLTREAAVACDRFIAEGTVAAVADGSRRGRVALTLDVWTWLKPAHGPRRLSVDVPDPAAEGATPRWTPGEVLLVMVPSDPDQLIDSYSGSDIASARAWVDPAIGRAGGMACPKGGKGTG